MSDDLVKEQALQLIAANMRQQDMLNRIAALEAERDQALAERDDNAAALREFIADRDRLGAEVARLLEALNEIADSGLDPLTLRESSSAEAHAICIETARAALEGE